VAHLQFYSLLTGPFFAANISVTSLSGVFIVTVCTFLLSF